MKYGLVLWLYSSRMNLCQIEVTHERSQTFNVTDELSLHDQCHTQKTENAVNMTRKACKPSFPLQVLSWFFIFSFYFFKLNSSFIMLITSEKALLWSDLFIIKTYKWRHTLTVATKGGFIWYPCFHLIFSDS